MTYAPKNWTGKSDAEFLASLIRTYGRVAESDGDAALRGYWQGQIQSFVKSMQGESISQL
jgi:hypothetical protein